MTRRLGTALALCAVAGCGPVAPAVTTATVPAPTTTTEAEAEVRKCTVPNVVGMVHQTAQDTMQTAGFYFLAEEDSTGQGRALVLDRNWETTAQSVAAGEEIDCTTKITLSAKKIGE